METEDITVHVQDQTDFATSQAFASDLVQEMTLPEKAGQLAQVEKNSITPDEVAEYAIGSVLSGGGGNPNPNTPENWARMVSDYVEAGRRSRLGIPVLYGVDAVHGHNNVVGATIFPHNIGLGSAGDTDLTERVFRAVALEVAATGIRWSFAPAVSVARDPRWGRTYESFGDDPALVAELAAAALRGLHWDRLDNVGTVLACLKHFVGDGGAAWGSVERIDWNDWWNAWPKEWQIDQGDTRIDEADLRALHLHPYEVGVAAGALSVMVSLGSWNGKKIHRHSELITGVLKGELGFEGFVVSDWLGISQLDADPYRCVVDAIGAGVDMAMIPIDYRLFIANVIAAVEVGDLDLSRVDDAVRRILTVKHALGLFSVDTVPAPPIDIVGADEHRTLAREAAAKSAVLLTDPNGVLPIRPGSVLVAGAGADDVGLQCGGWTIEWQGAVGPITQGTTILAGLEQSDAELNLVYRPDGDFEPGLRAPTGIAVIAEPPYAEGFGDDENLAIPKSDVDLIETLRQHVDSLVLVILSGRPLLLEPVIDLCDAVVAAWLPGSEASGIADVLTGAKPFSGRLRRRWPLSAEQAADPDGDWHPQWDYGHGVVS